MRTFTSILAIFSFLLGMSPALAYSLKTHATVIVRLADQKPTDGQSSDWDGDGTKPDIIINAEGILRVPIKCKDSFECEGPIWLLPNETIILKISENDVVFDDPVGYVTCSLRNGCSPLAWNGNRQTIVGEVTIRPQEEEQSSDQCIPSSRITNEHRKAAVVMNAIAETFKAYDTSFPRRRWSPADMTPRHMRFVQQALEEDNVQAKYLAMGIAADVTLFIAGEIYGEPIDDVIGPVVDEWATRNGLPEMDMAGSWAMSQAPIFFQQSKAYGYLSLVNGDEALPACP